MVNPQNAVSSGILHSTISKSLHEDGNQQRPVAARAEHDHPRTGTIDIDIDTWRTDLGLEFGV